jgi:hypothetical protein
MRSGARASRGFAGGRVQLECGHTIVVPAEGAVLANAADIVHHHLVCDGFADPDVAGVDLEVHPLGRLTPLWTVPPEIPLVAEDPGESAR